MKLLAIALSVFLAQSADASPTLRSFLAIALVEFSPNEIDGVMKFAEERKLDLDKPIQFRVDNKERVFIGREELKFDSKKREATYRGIVLKKGTMPLDVFVRDTYARLSKKSTVSHLSFLPAAHAQEDPATDSVVISVNTSIRHGTQGAAAVTSSYLDIMSMGLTRLRDTIRDHAYPSAPEIQIVSAKCSKTDLYLSTEPNSETWVFIKTDGKISILVNGKNSGRQMSAQGQDAILALLEKCPIPPNRLLTIMQNTMGQNNKMRPYKTSPGVTPPPRPGQIEAVE